MGWSGGIDQLQTCCPPLIDRMNVIRSYRGIAGPGLLPYLPSASWALQNGPVKHQNGGRGGGGGVGWRVGWGGGLEIPVLHQCFCDSSIRTTEEAWI